MCRHRHLRWNFRSLVSEEARNIARDDSIEGSIAGWGLLSCPPPDISCGPLQRTAAIDTLRFKVPRRLAMTAISSALLLSHPRPIGQPRRPPCLRSLPGPLKQHSRRPTPPSLCPSTAASSAIAAGPPSDSKWTVQTVQTVQTGLNGRRAYLSGRPRSPPAEACQRTRPRAAGSPPAALLVSSQSRRRRRRFPTAEMPR